MIRRIARKEFTEIVRDGRFRTLAVLLLAVSALSLAAGWKHYVDIERQHAQAQRATRAQWLAQPNKNPHSAAHYGVYVFKPKNRLSLMDTGIDPYVGVAAWLEAHKQNEFKYRPAQDRTAVQRFGELTAAQTLLVLMPLFIVLVTFALFSAEREQGTLRTLLSVGVSARRLAAGKAVGAAAALGAVLVPGVVMSLVSLGLTSEFGALSSDLPRAAMLGLCYLAYFVVFLALSLGLSARAASSRLALVMLLSFWFVNSLIATRAATDLAAALHPTPSAIGFQRGMEAELNDPRDLQHRLEERRQGLLRDYGVQSMAAVPVNFRGISLEEGENHGNEIFDRHYGRLFDRYAEQDVTARFAGLIAPLLPMRALSMGLSGTDLTHHRDFVNAAEGYRRGIQRLLNRDITFNSRDGALYEAGADLWASVPEFLYEAPGIGAVLRTHRWDLVLLAAWLAGAVWFAARSTAAVAVE